jgi:hypothetical protein
MNDTTTRPKLSLFGARPGRNTANTGNDDALTIMREPTSPTMQKVIDETRARMAASFRQRAPIRASYRRAAES